MLLSNPGLKDRRDAARGSNTAIFVFLHDRKAAVGGDPRPDTLSLTGAARWEVGREPRDPGRWDADGFAVPDAAVRDGSPRRAGLIRIRRPADGRYRRRHSRRARGAGSTRSSRRISRTQLLAALAASGASADEQAKFADAPLARIAQLGNAAVTTMPAARRAG